MSPVLFYFRPVLKKHFHRNSTAALFSLVVCLLIYVWVGVFAESPAGGQDSWNHFLYARWGFKHPILLLDQWGKTVFTILVAPLSHLGISAVLIFNTFCLLLSAWVVYLTARRLGIRNPWMGIFLMGLQPVVISNSFSMLTEPSMALMLAFVLYFFASNRYVSATILASFLPMARTEGYILLAAVLFFLILRKKWKLLPLALPGLGVYALIGGVISGDWAWIYHANPYFNVEHNPMAEAGKGDALHYLILTPQIQGWVVGLSMLPSLFMLAGYIVRRLQKKSPAYVFQQALWLWWPLVLLYFGAHSYSWYKGSFGSHGLHRVFLVIAPAMALLSMQTLDAVFGLQILWLNRAIKSLVVVLLLALGFPAAGMPYPWQLNTARPSIKGDPQVELAMQILNKKPEILKQGILAHQLPVLNAKLNLDPWGAEVHLREGRTSASDIARWPKEDKTLYLWSLSMDPKQDWFPDGTWLLIDNFYAVREGGIQVDQLLSNEKYSLQAVLNKEEFVSFSNGWTVYPPLSALKKPLQSDYSQIIKQFHASADGQMWLFQKLKQ